MNERSSRAHTLFILTLKQTTCFERTSNEPGPIKNTVLSQLFLADLGGSEQVKRSLVAPGHIDEHIG